MSSVAIDLPYKFELRFIGDWNRKLDLRKIPVHLFEKHLTFLILPPSYGQRDRCCALLFNNIKEVKNVIEYILSKNGFFFVINKIE